MSGLEVAATAVGIVSLGVQIGEGILRLKALASSIKEAPKDVQRFIDELELLNHVFTEIATAHKTGQLDDLPGSSAKECLSLCQNAADILHRVVKEVNSDIEKRKVIGSMKFVLKQGSIDRMRSSLHSAQLMLILSKQTLMEARNQAAQEKQRFWESSLQKEVQYLRSMMLPSPTSASSSELSYQCQTQDLSRDTGMLGNSEMYPKEEHCGTKERRRVAKTQNRLIARICFNATSWFNGHVWELHYSKTFSSINFSLRYYNIVSWNSPIIKSASRGNVQAVKRLLLSGQATIYDTDPGGSSLFFYAIQWSNLEFCKWLIDAGMDPNSTDWTLRDAIEFIACRRSCDNPSPSMSRDYNSQLETLNFLENYIDIDKVVDFEEGIPIRVEDSQTLEWMIRRSILRHKIHNVKFREKMVFTQSRYSQWNIGSLIKYALGGNKIWAEICHLKSSWGRTLLHNVLHNFGQCYHTYLYHNSSEEKPKWVQWTEGDQVTLNSELHRLMDIIRELVMAESSLHELSAPFSTWYPSIGTWRTPLLTLLEAFFNYCSEGNLFIFKKPKYRRFNVVQPYCVLEWLHNLKACGKNLVEYGTEEQMLHRKYDLGLIFNLCLTMDPTTAYRYRAQRLLGFTFGSEPKDWRFYFTEEMDSSFVEFWDMIDHPERVIPGAWSSYDPRDYLDDFYRMEELPWGPWHNFYDGNIPKAYEETFGRKFLHPKLGSMLDVGTGKWTTTI